MFYTRVGLSTLVLAALIGAATAFAQAPVIEPGVAASAPASERDRGAEVEKWTLDQWEAAKAKWSQERTKWADCQQSATDQKLTGTKSWAFLYRCMS